MARGVVFETDRRITYAAEELESRGDTVTRIRTPEDAERLPEPEKTDYVILPIRGTADGTFSVPPDTVNADAFLRSLPAGTVVLSGISTPYEEGLPCRYFNFQKDPSFVQKNSMYTAEGVLLLLLSQTPESIFEESIDLLGDGNTGREIGKLFHRLGLTFRWMTKEGGSGRIPLAEWQKTKPSPVIVNTIPAPVILPEQFAEPVRPCRIFDISSGGKGMPEEAKHLPCVLYENTPPLPGLAAPASAGHLLVELLQRKMQESG